MPATLADLRRFLTEHFSDQELTELCFDHFHEVYRNFGSGETVNAKVLALLGYCQRRDRLPELLAVLEKERPEPFGRVFGPRPAAATDRKGVPLLNYFSLINKVFCIALPGEGAKMLLVVQFYLLAFELLNLLIYLFILHRKLPDIAGRHSGLARRINTQKKLTFVRFENVPLSGELHQLAGTSTGTVGHVAPAVVAACADEAEQQQQDKDFFGSA